MRSEETRALPRKSKKPNLRQRAEQQLSRKTQSRLSNCYQEARLIDANGATDCRVRCYSSTPRLSAGLKKFI
jgi:hypothetical protein